MTSDDFLINHAYNNVWCVPEQDLQHIFRPARLSPPIGVRGSTDLIWSRYSLPTTGDWYHLYQVGPIIFENLGLEIDEMTWTSAGSQMVKQKMVIDAYLDNGRMIPREHVFLLATPDGNLAIAVKDTKIIGDFGTTPVFFRFYSNAYFSREDGTDPQEGIEYRYVVPSTTDSISTISKVWRDMQLKSGKCYAFVNGWKVQSINTSTVKRGDLVEIVRDSSIKAILEFPVNKLQVFLSTLDNMQKYFLHQTGKTDEIIDYRDDLDIFLLKRTNANVYSGVYFHKNSENSLRMVTHRDYSIPTHYVDRMTAMNPNWASTNQLTVQLVIRHGGLKRPLIDEAHHIRELYKLNDAQILQALIGTDSNVDVWKAASLEASMYTAIMRAPDGTVTRKMVEDAYGYNAISRIIGDTPQKVDPTNKWVQLPFGLRGESTIYEYDKDGLLINWYANTNVQWYVARNQACHYIEGIIGKGGKALTTVYGEDATLKDSINYRCYVCAVENGTPSGKWKDVTDDDTYYTVIAGKVVWNVNRTLVFTAVKFDDAFLTYDVNLNYADGLLRLTLTVEEVKYDGNPVLTLNEIPVGVLELWLNGHPIIEGLDWFMVGQEICIVNKVWRKRDGTADRITVRGTGFCNPDMTRIKQAEFGYVEQGWLSKNNRWNLRDDKVIRVTAGGRLFSRDELNWAENRPGVGITGAANGAPYQVIEPVVPLRGATLEDVYVMRALAEETDKQIEDYMTEVMGDLVLDGPNLIPGPHVLYSPFISKIMHDLMDGFIPEDKIDSAYSDMLVKEIGQPYEWLLAYEPTFKGLPEAYVNVHPHEYYHSVELGLYQYNFLRRVIRVYLNDGVDISKFISIKPLG